MSAEDVTRTPLSLMLNDGTVIAVNHFKSGFDDIDEFRRLTDAIRTAQASGDAPRRIVMGDMNHEVTDGAETPATFTSVPTGAPNSFSLGADLTTELASGLANDPFAHLSVAGLEMVHAEQKDGRLATRDSSGRRIDYFTATPALAALIIGTEIYDARDESLDGGLPKTGPQPAREATYDASDHFPIVLDVDL
jgi:hypothetical protein